MCRIGAKLLTPSPMLLAVGLLSSQIALAADTASAKLEDLANELAACSAYYAFGSEIVREGAKSMPSNSAADDIKALADIMLTQALTVAKMAALPDEQIMRRIKTAIEQFVVTINANPAGSRALMEESYERPCVILQEALPGRLKAITRPD